MQQTRFVLEQDVQSIFQNYKKEIVDAAHGKKTSLPFISNQLPDQTIVQNGEEFQAMAIGGTMYKCARLKRDGSEVTVLSEQEFVLPNFDTKETFLTFVGNTLEKDITKVAISFAYPMKPVFTGVLDGTLLFATKEHTFAGLIGETLGQTISNYLKKQTGRALTVSVANDTICLLLAGLTQYPWHAIAAGIVGTGMNFALFTKQTEAINLEAASFTNFPVSEAAHYIDANSQKLGEQVFEKEVAGKYLGEHFNYYAKKFGLPELAIADTKQLSELAEHGLPEAAELAEAVLRHSASLVACAVASVAQFGARPTTFVMQGSLFWNGYRYKEMVAEKVDELFGKKNAVNFIHIDNADILGAAKLIA